MTEVRIVVIDDHDVVRSTLRRSFERHSDIEVVGEAEGGEAGLEVVRVTNPDVVIVDAAMPGMDGAETIRRLLEESPFLVWRISPPRTFLRARCPIRIGNAWIIFSEGIDRREGPRTALGGRKWG